MWTVGPFTSFATSASSFRQNEQLVLVGWLRLGRHILVVRRQRLRLHVRRRSFRRRLAGGRERARADDFAHRATHSLQMKTRGPEISLRTSCFRLPQNEQKEVVHRRPQ
jgi:hypothetical protein